MAGAEGDLEVMRLALGAVTTAALAPEAVA